MTATQRPTSEGPVSDVSGARSGTPATRATEVDASGAALTTLRGAGVQVDVRRAGRVVVAVCLVALAVVAVVLLVAGIHKNAQINDLRQHGVDVSVRVTGCLGLLGGSGSNQAGYDCTGTFTLRGHRYSEDIPGNALRNPGTKVSAVAVAGDPPLLDTRHTVAAEHGSASVFIVPVILLVVLVLLVGGLVIRRRRGSAPTGHASVTS